MPDLLMTFLMQLVGRSPALLVAVVGLFLALIFWRRWPAACLFVFLALSLYLFLVVLSAVWSTYFHVVRVEWNLTEQQFATLASVVTITLNILYSISHAMLLAAVFVGRGRPSIARPPSEAPPSVRPTELDTRIER